MTYDQASDTIEEIVKIKAHLWQKSYISRDDIAQELRVKCWHLLDKYDPARGKSLKSFLNSCTQNFLRNLMRDSFSKFDPPCRKDCTHYDENGSPTEDSLSCFKFVKYLNYYNTKTSLRCPINTGTVSDINEIIHPTYTDETHILDMQIRDLLKISFPKNHTKMTKYYEDMICGREVPKNIRYMIQKALMTIKENINA